MVFHLSKHNFTTPGSIMCTDIILFFAFNILYCNTKDCISTNTLFKIYLFNVNQIISQFIFRFSYKWFQAVFPLRNRSYKQQKYLPTCLCILKKQHVLANLAYFAMEAKRKKKFLFRTIFSNRILFLCSNINWRKILGGFIFKSKRIHIFQTLIT